MRAAWMPESLGWTRACDAPMKPRSWATAGEGPMWSGPFASRTEMSMRRMAPLKSSRLPKPASMTVSSRCRSAGIKHPASFTSKAMIWSRSVRGCSSLSVGIAIEMPLGWLVGGGGGTGESGHMLDGRGPGGGEVSGDCVPERKLSCVGDRGLEFVGVLVIEVPVEAPREESWMASPWPILKGKRRACCEFCLL